MVHRKWNVGSNILEVVQGSWFPRCSGAAVVGGSEGDKQVTDKREADWLSEKRGVGWGGKLTRRHNLLLYLSYSDESVIIQPSWVSEDTAGVVFNLFHISRLRKCI